MCGIVGFINTELTARQSRKHWIRQALYVDQLRGVHATGLIVQEKESFQTHMFPPLKVYKRALCAADFLQLNVVEDMLLNGDNAKVVIGHNRHATTGSSSDDNFAHPFTHKNISLVHNGTLVSDNGLTSNYAVDSQNICATLGEVDSDKYADILAQLDGAFS